MTQLQGARDELREKAAPVVATAQEAAVTASAATAEQLTYLSAGVRTAEQAQTIGIVFNRLPKEQLLAAVGNASDGSPLADLFVSVAADRADQVREVLIAGIGRNAPSSEIAKELRTVADISRNRARTIARTELHRAARQASLDSYANNPRLILGWIWRCACDLRSCRACWAMHGTKHPHGEKFGSHPSCRCYAVPWLRDLRADPTQPDPRPQVETGEERFARLSRADQEKILGRTLYDHYAAGDVQLRHMVHRREDPRWGTTRSAATIEQVLSAAGKTL